MYSTKQALKARLTNRAKPQKEGKKKVPIIIRFPLKQSLLDTKGVRCKHNVGIKTNQPMKKAIKVLL